MDKTNLINSIKTRLAQDPIYDDELKALQEAFGTSPTEKAQEPIIMAIISCHVCKATHTQDLIIRSIAAMWGIEAVIAILEKIDEWPRDKTYEQATKRIAGLSQNHRDWITEIAILASLEQRYESLSLEIKDQDVPPNKEKSDSTKKMMQSLGLLPPDPDQASKPNPHNRLDFN